MTNCRYQAACIILAVFQVQVVRAPLQIAVCQVSRGKNTGETDACVVEYQERFFYIENTSETSKFNPVCVACVGL